jgi:DNA-directed RNA polymerase specialized sigma24 family protein
MLNRIPPLTNEASFESVAMLHLNDLYRTALHLLQQPGQASAAVEETFVRARTAFGEHPRVTNSRTRLFQILIQVVRLTRNPSMGGGSRSFVASAMNRIPLHFREALLMVDALGFSYNDASRILGRAEDVVAHHIIQGRNHLQSELERKCV